MNLRSATVLRRSDDHGIPHSRPVGENSLDVFGIDVPSVGKDDQVLFPSLEIQEPFVVQVAQVSSLVPPLVVEGCAGCVGVLPVSLCNVGAPGKYLAVVSDPDVLSG